MYKPKLKARNLSMEGTISPEPFFLTVGAGGSNTRFCIYHAPQLGDGQRCRGLVVFVPSLVDEMNKSRRMIALQARRFAEAGFAVLQIDLFGCGDSAGEFISASWHGWVDDIRQALAWLKLKHQDRLGSLPIWLWGLRVGALLAFDAAKTLDDPVNMLLWQPVVNGKQWVQQLMRIKVAGNRLFGSTHAGASAQVAYSWRDELESAGAIEVAGYRFSKDLVAAIESKVLDQCHSSLRRVVWCELSQRESPALSPVSLKCVNDLRSASVSVDALVVKGPAFWQSVEIEECRLLIERSVQMITGEKQ